MREKESAIVREGREMTDEIGEMYVIERCGTSTDGINVLVWKLNKAAYQGAPGDGVDSIPCWWILS